MLKHATVSRTSRAKQALQLHMQWQQQQKNQYQSLPTGRDGQQTLLPLDINDTKEQTSVIYTTQAKQQQPLACPDNLKQLIGHQQHLLSSIQQQSLNDESPPSINLDRVGLDVTDSASQAVTYYHSPSPQPPPSNLLCNSTLSSSLLLSPTSKRNNWLTIPGSPSLSPLLPRTICVGTSDNSSANVQVVSPSATLSPSKCSSESMIKVFAQSLSQDVEYVTLHVDTQTKSQQIIKSLLRKFRLKHRDPNLFYLTLERWIRKDGLRYKSVMLLGDEASPLQLQQCCSNPPHNDIKFTLQMRAGSLVKIYCSDVVPDARYKCLSLSTQTTAEETIELMLHCLNLAATKISATSNSNHNSTHLLRSSNSPSSTSSSASSSCSTSSGIESDSNHHQQQTCDTSLDNNALNLGSRTSSVTSISSSSNISSVFTNNTDQYCLIIECLEKTYERIIDSDEYLVEIYQNLLADAKGRIASSSTSSSSSIAAFNSHSVAIHDNTVATTQSLPTTPSKQQPLSSDQWFSIKLKKQTDCRISQSHSHSDQDVIKFVNPRRNFPLPPIPDSAFSSLNPLSNGTTESLANIVSTTQIEVSRPRPVHSKNHHITSISNNFDTIRMVPSLQLTHPTQPQQNNSSKMPPPPEFILLPPIRPRRRNLSNASTTFCRTTVNKNSITDALTSNISRRRYDPAQLAEDLSKLDVAKELNSCLLQTSKTSSTDNFDRDPFDP